MVVARRKVAPLVCDSERFSSVNCRMYVSHLVVGYHFMVSHVSFTHFAAEALELAVTSISILIAEVGRVVFRWFDCVVLGFIALPTDDIHDVAAFAYLFDDKVDCLIARFTQGILRS